MNQKLSWTLLAAGGALFLGDLGHIFASHSTWHELASPPGVGEILGALAFAVTACAGALGVVLKKGSES